MKISRQLQGEASISYMYMNSPDVSGCFIPSDNEAVLPLGNLHCPGRLQPHYTAQVAHVDGRDDPVCNVSGGEQPLLVYQFISLHTITVLVYMYAENFHYRYH